MSAAAYTTAVETYGEHMGSRNVPHMCPICTTYGEISKTTKSWAESVLLSSSFWEWEEWVSSFGGRGRECVVVVVLGVGRW